MLEHFVKGLFRPSILIYIIVALAGYVYIGYLKSEIKSCKLDLDISRSVIEAKDFECEQVKIISREKEKVKHEKIPRNLGTHTISF